MLNEASRLAGLTVYTRNGQRLGVVHDVLLDTTQRVISALLITGTTPRSEFSIYEECVGEILVQYGTQEACESAGHRWDTGFALIGIIGAGLTFSTVMSMDGQTFIDQIDTSTGVEKYQDYQVGDEVIIVDKIVRIELKSNGNTHVWLESIGKSECCNF